MGRGQGVCRLAFTVALAAAVLLGVALSLPLAAGSQEKALANLLEKLQERYASAKDVQADFTQDYFSTTLGKTTQSASGHVVFKKPGKMRWDYAAPEEQHVVSDGKTLWFHQPRIRQVLVSEVTEEVLSKYTVSFLMGVGDVRKDFKVEAADLGTGAQARPIRLVLHPVHEAPFTKVELEVAPDTYLVQATVIHDHFGGVNRISFTELRTNTGVQDALFGFEAPEGVQVIRSPGPMVQGAP